VGPLWAEHLFGTSRGALEVFRAVRRMHEELILFTRFVTHDALHFCTIGVAESPFPLDVLAEFILFVAAPGLVMVGVHSGAVFVPFLVVQERELTGFAILGCATKASYSSAAAFPFWAPVATSWPVDEGLVFSLAALLFAAHTKLIVSAVS